MRYLNSKLLFSICREQGPYCQNRIPRSKWKQHGKDRCQPCAERFEQVKRPKK